VVLNRIKHRIYFTGKQRTLFEIKKTLRRNQKREKALAVAKIIVNQR
jgi:hypothetical protein